MEQRNRLLEKLSQLDQLINVEPVVGVDDEMNTKRFPSMDTLLEKLHPLIESQLKRIELEFNDTTTTTTTNTTDDDDDQERRRGQKRKVCSI
jgi:hypothetical protein